MRWRQRLLAVVGLAVLALAVAVSRGAAGGVVPVEPLVSLLGNDYFLVAALGGLSLAVAGAALASGRSGNVSHATTPDPEEPVTLPVPGDGVDATVEGWRSSLPLVAGRRRRRLQERLREAAVEAVARREACGLAEAEQRVEAGRWTSDPVAAAFVGGSTLPGRSLAHRLRGLLAGETLLQWQVRRTVDAIGERQAGHVEVTDGGSARH